MVRIGSILAMGVAHDLLTKSINILKVTRFRAGIKEVSFNLRLLVSKNSIKGR